MPASNYDISDLTTGLYLAIISSNSDSKMIKSKKTGAYLA